MRSFLQYLKEEEQQTTLGGWWFRARNTWGGGGEDQNAGAPAVLGSVQSWGDSVFVRMLNMPQFMLDMFDYNGDGTIGDNDQELIFQIAELAYEIYEETGEYPPPITAADYLQNWEYYSELYGKDFPQVSVLDWVNSQKMLSEKLGINKWHLVIGGSLGGMQALQWSITFPDSVNKAGILAAAAKSSTQNIALNEVAREAIRKDPNFMDGDYSINQVKPKDGIKTARMLGHITYLSEKHMDLRFGRRFQEEDSKVSKKVDFEVENYLQYKGEKFSENFDANSYILMTKAMDGYDIAQDKNTLETNLQNVKASLLIVGFYTDWLYPPERGKDIQIAAINQNVKSSYIVLSGEHGHDSFLFKNEKYVKTLKEFIESK